MVTFCSKNLTAGKINKIYWKKYFVFIIFTTTFANQTKGVPPFSL